MSLNQLQMLQLHSHTGCRKLTALLPLVQSPMVVTTYLLNCPIKL